MKIKSPLYISPRFYEFAMGLMGANRRYAKIAELAGKKGVFELGCGTGKLQDFLKGGYSGIDLNQGFVEYGRKKGRNVRLGDAQKIRTFDRDVVVVADVLHHLPNAKQFLQKILKSGKKVIACEPFDSHALLLPLANMLDWDGINAGREKWLGKAELVEFFRSNGASRLIENGGHVIAVFEENGETHE